MKKKRMIKVFEDLKQSLHDALLYEQGKKAPVRVTEVFHTKPPSD